MPRKATTKELNKYREGDTLPGGGFINPFGQVVGGTSSGIGGANTFDTPEYHQQLLNTNSDEEPTNEGLYGDDVENVIVDDDTNNNKVKESDFTVDEDAIRRRVMRMFQGEIDATNDIYAQKLREQQQTGFGRLGSTRAIQARSGLLGSDFGASQKEKVSQFNVQERGLIQAEQAAKIAEILGEARGVASDEIAAEREALQQDYETYQNYLTQKEQRKNANLANLATRLHSQGIDINSMSEEELRELATSYGSTVDEIYGAYETNRPEGAELDTQVVDVGGRKVLVNTQTGETIRDLGISKVGQSGSGSGSESDGGVSYLTEGVLTGIGELSELTPTQYAEVVEEIVRSGRGGELKEQANSYALSKVESITNAVDEALRVLKTADGPALLRSAASRIPGTDAYDFKTKLDRVFGNIAFNELQKMRTASKTGGALGQVSERELALLGSVEGSLDIGQSASEIKSTLESIKQSAQTWGDEIQNSVGLQSGGSLAEQVDAAGYDYQAMVDDGLTDDQIREAVGL